MPQQLPRKLLFALGVISVASFALSIYLELYQLQFLQNHPITVNLVSGVVGFCTAGVVLGYGFIWLNKRDAAAAGKSQLATLDASLRGLLRQPTILVEHLMDAVDLVQAAKIYLSDHAPRIVAAMKASAADPIQGLIREARRATAALDKLLWTQEIDHALMADDAFEFADDTTLADEVTARAIQVWKCVFRVADNIESAERRGVVLAILDARPGPPAEWEQQPPTMELVKDLARFGMTTQAIKTYRRLTGADLKDSVDAIDAMGIQAWRTARPD